MPNQIIFAVLLCLNSVVYGQIKTQAVLTTALPDNIRYKGKPLQATRFQDNTGVYLALTTQTGEQPQKGDDEFRQAHLYTYLYKLNGTATPIIKWQLHDLVSDCNLDIVANFVPAVFKITDLNKNGNAEVWVAYRLGCMGDISPSEFKIIMFEGVTKYAIRGIGRLTFSKTGEHDGGTISSDDFKAAPATFKQYAHKLWNKYVQETTY